MAKKDMGYWIKLSIPLLIVIILFGGYAVDLATTDTAIAKDVKVNTEAIDTNKKACDKSFDRLIEGMAKQQEQLAKIDTGVQVLVERIKKTP